MKKMLTTKPRWVLLMLAFCFWCLQSYADTEPNDNLATAENATFGATVSGSLNQAPVGDLDDYYLIVAPSDGNITLTADIGAGLNVYIHLYDKTGAGNVQSYAAGGTTVSITKTCMAADTFLVRIDHYQYAGSYSFTTSVSGSSLANDVEDNGSLANTSQFISEGETVEGHIGYYDTDLSWDEYDYFGVILPEDGSYTFRAIIDNNTNSTFYLHVNGKLDNQYTQIYCGGDTTIVTVDCLAADTVYLVVDRYSGCGGYTLSFENSTPPGTAIDIEDNGSIADVSQFISEGESVTGHIGYYDTDIGYDEYDYFGVILPADGSYTFRAIKDLGKPSETFYLNVFGKNNASFGQVYSYTDTTFLSVDCLAEDTVYIRVDRYNGCGGYTLSFENTTPPGVPNDIEDNGSITDVSLFISAGESVTGHIGYYDTDIGHDEYDYFGVILPEDGNYTFRAIKDLDKPSETFYLNVFGKDGANVGQVYSYGDTTLLTVTCLAADTVYMRVDRYTGCGGYTLSFGAPELTYSNDTGDNENLASASTVPTSSVNEGHIGYYDTDTGTDGYDYYKFTVVQVPFELDIKVDIAETLNAYINLYNSAGSNIQSEYHTPGSYNITRTINVAGDYYVAVDHYTGCGSYSLGNFCASAPEVAITAGGPTDICPGESVTLTATAGLNAYSWIKDGIVVGSAQNFVAMEPGTYVVAGYDINGCDGLSEEVVIGVFDVPAVSISTDDETTFCAGGSITLTATAGFDSYEWSNGNSGQSIEVSESGNYTVTATTEDGCDKVSSNSIDVIVQVDSDGDGICDVDDSCPNFAGQIGDDCDDGDPDTENDVINDDCQCVGTPTSLENTAALCSDGIDNDGNGLIDCEDPGCQSISNNIGCLTCFEDGLSFADEVIEYVSTCTNNVSTNPEAALGMPDYSGSSSQHVTLGRGFIKLGFTNNTLVNSGTPDADLFVFEVGPIVESSFIELRPSDAQTEALCISAGILDSDEDGFYEFGGVGGALASVDIDAFFDDLPANSIFFDAIKIVDAPGSCSTSTPGADIDAVCALSSIECVVGASCDDGDPTTENDMLNADCQCVGTPIACESPSLNLAIEDADENPIEDCIEADGVFYVNATLSGGSGNASYNVSANGGDAVDVAADGSHIFGPFDAGSSVAILAAGADDATCGAEGSIDSPEVCAPACESPSLDLTIKDADGNPIEDCIEADGEFYVNATLSSGSGNASYNVSANGGDAVSVAADGSHIFGPFDAGTSVAVSATGADDAVCGAEASIDSPEVCVPPCESPSLSLGVSDVNASPIQGCIPADGVFYVDFHLAGGSGNNTYDVAVNGDYYETVNAGSQWHYHFGPFNAGEVLDFVVTGADDAACGAEGSIPSPDICTPTCESPSLDLAIEDADGNPIEDCIEADGAFYVNATLSGGSGNDSYNVTVNGGDAVNVAADGSHLFGPFDAGSSVAVSASGADDAVCGAEGSVDSPEICPPDNYCPDLDLYIGDPCPLNGLPKANGMGIVNDDCECVPVIEPVCENFVYFLSDHSAADGIADIYMVTLNGGNADLDYIATSEIEVHIAYNQIDNLIYAVSKHTNSYRVLNPYAAVPTFGPTVDLGADYGELTAAAFNADGKLLIGSQNNNAIYSVNIATNVVSPYDTYAPVTGGDIAFGSDGMLYLATRTGNGLYEVWTPPTADQFIGSAPSNVTGLAITDADKLLMSSKGSTNLMLSNSDGSPAGSYAVLLNGEPYTLRDGDMASGCDSHTNVEDDCGYKLYYIHAPAAGGNRPLLEVTLNNDGTASYNAIIANIGGHIGLSPDGATIYNVTGIGTTISTIDVATASIVHTANIVTTDGTSPDRFPACLVSADGTVYIGSNITNQVYTIDPLTGTAVPFGPSRTVQGGDLIEVDGEIWVVTRNDNRFTNVLTGENFTVPVNEINGAAVLSNGNVLLSDGNGGSLMKEVDISTQEIVATYDIGLPLMDGDLAGGCTMTNPLIEGCYGVEILDFNQGAQTNGGAVAGDRSDENEALGEPDRSNAPGGFVSLGVGGHITIGFAGVVNDEPGNDIKIYETSYSGDACGSSDDERADIELSADGVNFVSVGTICRDGEVDMADVGLTHVSAIRITNSASTGSLDGYDVDGVEAIYGCGSALITGDDDAPRPAEEAASELTSYPNPTSGPSQVVFSAAETGTTIVEVYDMNGRNIATLFNQVAKAKQEYRLDFDGNYLPNGVYIYRLTTNNETIIDKFMIAK